jgi:hypothetical protein
MLTYADVCTDEGLNHPNQYFRASLQYYEDKEESEGKSAGKSKEQAVAQAVKSDPMPVETPA